MKAKLLRETLNEGFATEEGRRLDSVASILGYDDLHEMLGDNPGLYEACIEWIDQTFADRFVSEMIEPDVLEDLGLYHSAELVKERDADYEMGDSE